MRKISPAGQLFQACVPTDIRLVLTEKSLFPFNGWTIKTSAPQNQKKKRSTLENEHTH